MQNLVVKAFLRVIKFAAFLVLSFQARPYSTCAIQNPILQLSLSVDLGAIKSLRGLYGDLQYQWWRFILPHLC